MLPLPPVRRSIHPDRITCLVCGKSQKTLTRHLGTAHELTPAAVRRDPAPDRRSPALAAAPPGMSVDSNVRNNPTGEVRPRSHKCVPNQARSGLALPRERCGARFRGL